ncbi:MAG TPA: PaaI family thioesterase, partial [Acidimicrobiia bacterium]|nr:PaaI family thioesterase [Acidimicrobiia bacterium]
MGDETTDEVQPDEAWPHPEVPLHEYLGVEFEHVGDGRSVIRLPLSDHVRGLVAPVHGGVLATLSDIACGAAMAGSFDPAVEVPVSVDLHVRYYRQPKASPVVAEATIVHRGSRIVGVECSIRDADGLQVARTAASYM